MVRLRGLRPRSRSRSWSRSRSRSRSIRFGNNEENENLNTTFSPSVPSDTSDCTHTVYWWIAHILSIFLFSQLDLSPAFSEVCIRVLCTIVRMCVCWYGYGTFPRSLERYVYAGYGCVSMLIECILCTCMYVCVYMYDICISELVRLQRSLSAHLMHVHMYVRMQYTCESVSMFSSMKQVQNGPKNNCLARFHKLT